MVKQLQYGCIALLPLTYGVTLSKAAEHLQLSTGEVLIGHVVSEDERDIIFASEGLGRLTIPVTPDILRTPITKPDTEQANKDDTSTPIAKAPDTQTVKPRSPWKVKLEGGFSLQERGKSDSNHTTSIRGEITRKSGPNNFRGHMRYLVTDQNGERSNDRLDAGLALRHYLHDRFYLRGDLLYRFDRLRNFSNDFEGTLGCTYYLWKTDRFKFWLGPGATLNYSEPETEESGYRWLGNVQSGFDLGLSERLALEHRSVYLFRFEDINDYRLRVDEVLKAIVTDHLSVGLRYEFEFESILPYEDGRSEHRLFTTMELRY